MPDTISAASSERARLQTAEEVAERLQVPRSFVYTLARKGSIPTVRLGKYVRFDPDAIEQWLSSR